MAHDDVIREQLEWIADGKAGCVFAAVFAIKPVEGKFESIVIPGQTFDQTLPEKLNAILDAATGQFEAVQIICPDVTSANEVAGLIQALCLNERWGCVEIPPKGDLPEVLLVGLRWVLPDKKHVNWVLGFANLDSMPATRRSPHASVLLRVGPPGPAPEIGLEIPNEAANRKPDPAGYIPVHAADMETMLSKNEHIKKMWERTAEAKAGELEGDPLALAAQAKVTFSLPRSIEPELTHCLNRGLPNAVA